MRSMSRAVFLVVRCGRSDSGLLLAAVGEGVLAGEEPFLLGVVVGRPVGGEVGVELLRAQAVDACAAAHSARVEADQVVPAAQLLVVPGEGRQGGHARAAGPAEVEQERADALAAPLALLRADHLDAEGLALGLAVVDGGLERGALPACPARQRRGRPASSPCAAFGAGQRDQWRCCLVSAPGRAGERRVGPLEECSVREGDEESDALREAGADDFPVPSRDPGCPPPPEPSSPQPLTEEAASTSTAASAAPGGMERGSPRRRGARPYRGRRAERGLRMERPPGRRWDVQRVYRGTLRGALCDPYGWWQAVTGRGRRQVGGGRRSGYRPGCLCGSGQSHPLRVRCVKDSQPGTTGSQKRQQTEQQYGRESPPPRAPRTRSGRRSARPPPRPGRRVSARRSRARCAARKTTAMLA